MSIENVNVPPDNHIKVLDGQGWIGLLDRTGTESTIVNAARVSLGKVKTEMDEKDVKLLKYLIDNKHTSPLEHVNFTFSVHCPLFVRSQWHRHRTFSFSETSRRYTSDDLQFFTPQILRKQSKDNKQASEGGFTDFDNTNCRNVVREANLISLQLYNTLIEAGVCREQARGVLTQNLMTTFWATVDLHNLLKFLDLRDHPHAQVEIKEYAQAIKKLSAPSFPNIAQIYKW